MTDDGKHIKRDREDDSKKIRAFVAIELPDSVIRELSGLQEDIRKSGLNAKWTRPESIHLTLKFLGSIDVARVGEISERIASAAGKSAPMTLFAQGLGVFPNVRRPRVLWTGTGGDIDVLAKLQQAVENELGASGFEMENRRFAGHYTLARFKERADPDAVISVMEHFGHFVSTPFTAGSINLFQSRLSPRGAVYTKLLSHRLGR